MNEFDGSALNSKVSLYQSHYLTTNSNIEAA